MASRLGNADEVFFTGHETGIFLPHHGIYASALALQQNINACEVLGKKVFLEKTPKHVHVIDRIKWVSPGALIVLMIRNPLDTCASLYERFGDLNYAIERWCMDAEAAVRAKSRFEDLIVVRFEELTASPDQVLERLYGRLGLVWNPEVVKGGRTKYDFVGLSGNMELRRRQVSEEIRQNPGRGELLFSESQRREVYRRTQWYAYQLGLSETGNSTRL
ncbi:sulfotransferase family protein [Tamilnaduibacter salinus]|nr:sulfotransferase [Tamilnaduibacter salinus]